MSRKKGSNVELSQEDTQQVQHLLAQYHEIAQTLHSSTNQAQVESALIPIHSLSEAVQLAFLKALAKENETDAADVLAAVNALGPDKEVRKEARRSLIRLETTKTYPQWTPPIARTAAIQVNIPNPPRFWKGLVTQARDQGEVQLILVWEQGYEYSEARSISFLLDYWHDGVSDVFIETASKRHINEYINNLHNKLKDVELVGCTVAEGKRLVEEALSVNTWRGTTPHKDFRNNLPTINSLILQASDVGEDRGLTFINPELTDEEVVINFLGAWSMGDYGLTYDLLSSNSNIHEGSSRAEWIELHRAWADEAHPTRLELGFSREREPRQSAIWLPTATKGSPSSSHKEVDIGWSLELAETPLSGTLREMPMGTVVNKETGRHWFWTSYSLVQEQNRWRIQRMTDEGTLAQGLSITELQRLIEEYEKAIDEKVEQREADIEASREELSWRLTQLMHYYDALIARLPLDRAVCNDAYNWAVTMGNPERTMVYVERLARRFPEYHSNMLRTLAATQVAYAYSDRTQNMPERREHFLKMAEATLHEAITNDNSSLNHALLAEIYLSEQRNDEAEAELLQARAMNPGLDEEVAIEAGLGNIAMRRERFSEAIPHFQRVTDLRPQAPGIWFALGFAHRLLGQFDAAEASYKRGVQVDPHDPRVYSELIAIYMNRSDKQEAQHVAEQAVQNNPDSAHLHALLASVLFELGNQRGAQRELEAAESIDPELEIVQSVRQQYLHTSKKK